jgi:pimeloyl-ACP methyl ester carboxylesterase
VGSAAGKLCAAASAAALSASLTTSSSQAAIPWQPCGQSNAYACASLTVPLDRSGVVPGSVTLAMRRHRAPAGEPRSAVIALAGGPGQAALPITEEFTEILGPILATRDLIVFDQRGTGSSGPLACHAFETARQFHSAGALIAECGNQLGPARAFYTSLDSVADIEAIRIAGGYEKLVLYGTSYGTKVAELYAEEHPEHVEALVLDSVVPPNGPDPLDRSTFAAVPRVLRSLCTRNACAHVTSEPVADLSRVVREMRRGPLRARVIGKHGRARVVSINSDQLLDLLVDGDLAPELRGEFVTAVRAAAEDDNAPLGRLFSRVEGASEPEEFDTPLYFATICEEEDFPWSRSGSPAARLAQAKAAIAALPASALAPFTRSAVLGLSDMPACAYWPFASPAPPVSEGALPDVPTLILSGADDLRTPTANARAVAAEIPDAHLLVVPYTGHSVLTQDPTSCAHEALLAQFEGTQIKPCRASAVPAALLPPPLPPTRLANVAPARGYAGTTGRTLHALNLTLSDLARQLVVQLAEALASGQLTIGASLDSGGLRAGWARDGDGTLELHGYTYVPGVTISGEIGPEESSLRVGGSAAAAGTLHLGRHHKLVGALGGQSVQIGTGSLSSSSTTVSVGFGTKLGSASRALRLAGARVLDGLAHSLDRLPLPAAGA